MSNLLINEPPLMVLPSLASKIGLNEAIILQQVHYWLDPRGNKNKKEGRHWVYNSYKQWIIQFPFFSDRTIRRTIQNLEQSNLLIAKEFNKSAGDKTKWYSINYEQLSLMELSSRPSGQNGHMGMAKVATPSGQNGQIIYKDTETTTDIISSPIIPNPTSGVKVGRGGDKKNVFEKDPIAQNMIDLWDSIVKEGREEKTFLRLERQQRLLAILEECFENNLQKWKNYCLKITSSKFLMGETKEKFKVKIDWAIKIESIEKILEGTVTVGDRVIVSGESETDLFFQARRLYDRLEEEELEVYKKLYVAFKQKKNPHFSLEGSGYEKNDFKHFVVMEINKTLCKKEKV